MSRYPDQKTLYQSQQSLQLYHNFRLCGMYHPKPTNFIFILIIYSFLCGASPLVSNHAPVRIKDVHYYILNCVWRSVDAPLLLDTVRAILPEGVQLSIHEHQQVHPFKETRFRKKNNLAEKVSMFRKFHKLVAMEDLGNLLSQTCFFRNLVP